MHQIRLWLGRRHQTPLVELTELLGKLLFGFRKFLSHQMLPFLFKMHQTRWRLNLRQRRHLGGGGWGAVAPKEKEKRKKKERKKEKREKKKKKKERRELWITSNYYIQSAVFSNFSIVRWHWKIKKNLAPPRKSWNDAPGLRPRPYWSS